MTQVQSTGTPYIIYTPSVFLQDVQQYVATYWQTYGGYVPTIVATDNFPQYPNHAGFRQALKASIASFAATGAKYFHLIGDWNDWREFNGDLYQSLWVGAAWDSIRNEQLQIRPHDRQPELDIIPSYVIPDNVAPDQCMSNTPYWFNDQEYADTNGDHVPDVVVTRWPISNSTDLIALALKMQIYNTWPGYQAPYTVSLYVRDDEHLVGSGDGVRAAGVADAVIAEIAGQRTYRVNSTQYSVISGWVSAVQNNWITLHPDVVVIIGSRWNAYAPKGLVIPSLPPHALPIVVGASCQAADFAHTEINWSRPVFHRLLTAPSGGTIAWIGPTAGTWQEGNDAVVRNVLNELFANTTRPMAESWLKGVQNVLTGSLIPNIVKTARSYVFLGDPLSRLRHSDVVTDVGTGVIQHSRPDLAQNVPNPFNPSTRIRFTTTRAGYVSLTVFDIAGHSVRRLVHATLPAGSHEIQWNARDEAGRAVGAGVYLYRLVAEGTTTSRKFAVVK